MDAMDFQGLDQLLVLLLLILLLHDLLLYLRLLGRYGNLLLAEHGGCTAGRRPKTLEKGVLADDQISRVEVFDQNISVGFRCVWTSLYNLIRPEYLAIITHSRSCSFHNQTLLIVFLLRILWTFRQYGWNGGSHDGNFSLVFSVKYLSLCPVYPYLNRWRNNIGCIRCFLWRLKLFIKFTADDEAFVRFRRGVPQ